MGILSWIIFGGLAGWIPTYHENRPDDGHGRQHASASWRDDRGFYHDLINESGVTGSICIRSW